MSEKSFKSIRNREVASVAGGNQRYATSAIMREIDRRIRTGEYKNH